MEKGFLFILTFFKKKMEKKEKILLFANFSHGPKVHDAN